MSKGFKDELIWLSNMYVFKTPITINGEVIRSSENYYMSRKTDDLELRKKILEMSPGKAKKFCKTIKLTKGWNKKKIDVMREALAIKFSIPYLRIKLLGYDGDLTEYNTWNDTFWGVCNGEGKDNLGILLRELRVSLLKQDNILKTIRYGNLYKDTNIKYKCFTANSTVLKNGELVMGAGTALEVKKLYPNTPKIFGAMIAKNSKLYGTLIDYKNNIIAFQTKVDWRKTSNLEIVKNSVSSLSYYSKFLIENIGLPFPGIGNGGMSENHVLSTLEPLPALAPSRNGSKVIIYKKKKDKYVTCVGSRTLPDSIKPIIERLSEYLTDVGYVIRSGGAIGTDSAFVNSSSDAEVYTPSEENEGVCKEHLITPDMLYSNNKELKDKAVSLAKQHHPVFDNLKPFVKKLMIRNTHQVLGRDLNTPSDFVFAYTEDGAKTLKETTSKTGGTGLAIRIADSYNLYVFNLGNFDDMVTVLTLLKISYNIVESKNRFGKAIECDINGTLIKIF